jgi:hypothetical protein
MKDTRAECIACCVAFARSRSLVVVCSSRRSIRVLRTAERDKAALSAHYTATGILCNAEYIRYSVFGLSLFHTSTADSLLSKSSPQQPASTSAADALQLA